jgi:hypothetical protein
MCTVKYLDWLASLLLGAKLVFCLFKDIVHFKGTVQRDFHSVF